MPREAKEKKTSEKVEEYLEAIYIMSKEGGPVIGARLAERLGVTPPTVTGMLQRLSLAGLITSNDRKEILLTAKGLETAEATVRRHRLSERLLTDLLGLEWHKAHDEACRFEHAISPEVEEKLIAALGSPTTCPHGNPIPGAPVASESQNTVPLSEVPAGTEVIVDRISEDAETDSNLMRYLQISGILPGARLRVESVAPWGETINLHNGERAIPLGLSWAAKIQVRAEDTALATE